MPKRTLWLSIFVLSVLVLAFSSVAKANTVTIDGSVSFWDGIYGIPPYGGTLNGVKESFYCVDFSATIAPPYSWNVNITSLTGSDFSLTRLKDQTKYLEMAWLITKMIGATTQMQKTMYQYAVWSFTGGPNPYGSNSTLVAAALAAVQGGKFDGQGWEILTPTGKPGQEFLILVGVPEPGELLLLIIGLGVLGLTIRKKQTTKATEA